MISERSSCSSSKRTGAAAAVLFSLFVQKTKKRNKKQSVCDSAGFFVINTFGPFPWHCINVSGAKWLKGLTWNSIGPTQRYTKRCCFIYSWLAPCRDSVTAYFDVPPDLNVVRTWPGLGRARLTRAGLGSAGPWVGSTWRKRVPYCLMGFAIA
jgi:hypothetical protein